MPEETTGSTLQRRQLGRHLKALRKEAGLSVAKAAVKLERSTSTINRIEAGTTGLRSMEVQIMCTVYGAPPELTEALKALAGMTALRGWWHRYNDAIPEELNMYIGLEEAAQTLRRYDSELVPGLLQIEAYTRVLVLQDQPNIDEETIGHIVQVRQRRQTLLTRREDRLHVKAVLNEAILRRVVGSKAIMAEQLSHLLRMAKLPNVSIRVMPFAADLHQGMTSGPFVFLEFPTNEDGITEPPVVYLESLLSYSYLDDEQVTGRYAEAHNDIWRKALTETASAGLISAILKELTR